MIIAAYLFLSLTSSMLAVPFSLFAPDIRPTVIPSEAQAVCDRPAFSGSRLSDTLATSGDVLMADLDNDGRLDIAMRGPSIGSTLWIQRGTGNGYFGAPEVVATNLNGFALTGGDFNNDGNFDLVAASGLYLGLGNGTFSPPIPITLDPNARPTAIGDFNGDDNLDIAAFLFSNGTYHVLLGNGAGGFGATPVILSFSSSASGLEPADFNNDGVTDYSVLLGNNTVSVALANTNGTYATPVNYLLGVSVQIAFITSGDIDSDGDRDIVGVGAPLSGPSSYQTILLNNGSGAFTVQTNTFPNTFQQTRAILGDADSDGDLDLIYNHGSLLSIARGNNNGTFQLADPPFPGLASPGRFFFEDLTGDGIRDLASSTGAVPSFAVFPNSVPGIMGAKQHDIEDDFFSNGAEPGDFNEDGKPDVVWINDQLNFKVAFGDGAGGFGTISNLVSPKIPRAVMVTDFNNDDNEDIVLIAHNNGEFGSPAVVYLGNGNGTFQPHFFFGPFLAPQAAKNPHMADLNGDGFPDLITQDSVTSRVFLTQNVAGNGQHANRGALSTGNTFGSVTTGDFDMDGRTDVAMLSFFVHIFLNRENGGNWAWDNVGAFPASDSNLDILASDFNEDGVPDLAVSGLGGTNLPGKVSILLGVGKGGFGAPRQYAVSIGPGDLEAADFDGDGNVDLATSNSPSTTAFGTIDQRVAVLYGDGLGAFPRIAFTAAATNPRYLMVADLDTDNNPDIGVVDHNLAVLTVLTNTCLPAPAANFPTLSANADVNVTEGATADVVVNLTVTLSGVSSVPIRVGYYTTPQVGIVGESENELFEASGRSDYVPARGELVFTPGQTSKTVQVVVRHDLADEYDEKFNVFLSNATNAGINDKRTVVTVIDNDDPPVVSIGNATSPEGNSGATPLGFQLSLSAVSGKAVTVQFQTGGGTAIPNQDYAITQGAYTVPAGQLTSTIPVNVFGDLTLEPDETLRSEISQPLNATIGNGSATGTIVNDDVGGSVQFSSATYAQAEGGSVNITISRSGGNAGGVSVRFRTQAGTALPGEDYTETVTTVLFGDNETSKSVFVPLTFDQLDEPDETLSLILDQPSGVTIGNPGTAVLTILGTNALADLTIGDASIAEGDTGIRQLVFSLRLSRPVQRQVSVNYATANGTATAGTDYQAATGVAILVPGMTRRTITVPIIGDFLPETDETFFVDLSGVVNANLADNQALGRILSDEINTSTIVRLISANPAGNGSGNTDSYDPYLSRDGKVAAFRSIAGNLSPSVPDTNGLSDIYVRNLTTQATQLVSVNRFGTNGGNGNSNKPYISADGNVIAFTSFATDLTLEGSGGGNTGSVFVRDLQAGQTRLASITTGGNAAVADVVGISGNGRFVVFHSAAPDLTSIPDTQTFVDVFVRDMQTNVTHLISVNAAGNAPGNANSGDLVTGSRTVGITPDGRYVLFSSSATDLVPTPVTTGPNLFVRDLQTQTTIPVSVNADGSALVGGLTSGSISDNGRYVFFNSSSNAIVPNDSNSSSDVFRRDLQTSTTQLVSVNLAGTGTASGVSYDGGGSADGRYAVFVSDATNISSTPLGAVRQQVYRRDMTSGVTQMASINAAGTGSGSEQSYWPAISGDGQTVIFTTASNNLVAAGVDVNSSLDTYMRDFSANVNRLVSITENGTTAGNTGTHNGSISGTISYDGNVVGFRSTSSDIVAIDTNGFAPDAFAFYKTLPPMPIADFDGDGKSDFGVFRPSSATWYVLKSSDGSFLTQQFGMSTDVPVARDYDGDGKTDLAAFRQGVWHILNSSNNTATNIAFGVAGDIPVPGDYDGDRKADLGIYRQGSWEIRESSDGNVRTVQFGAAGDVTAVADYDGDFRDDIGVYRNGIWYIIQSHDFSERTEVFGIAGDKPAQGDFDGDRKADIALWRPSNGTWYFIRSSNGSDGGLQWGANGDRPVPGDYDGDRRTDFGVWRSTDGIHYIVRNSGGFIGVAWGGAGDIPVLASPSP